MPISQPQSTDTLASNEDDVTFDGSDLYTQTHNDSVIPTDIVELSIDKEIDDPLVVADSVSKSLHKTFGRAEHTVY